MSELPPEEKSFSYNSATLSGSLDVIVVGTKDKQFRCSNFMLTIGKMMMLNVAGKEVAIWINGYQCKHKMRVMPSGTCYFDPSVLPKFNSKNRTKSAPEPANETKDDGPARNTDPGRVVSDPYQINSQKDNRPGNQKIEIAICAHLIKPDMSALEKEDVFEQHRLSFDDFRVDPHSYLRDPNLMVRIDGKLFDAFFGIPQLLSLNVFQKELNINDIPDNRFPGQHKGFGDLARREKINPKVPIDLFEGVPLHPGRNDVKYVFVGNFGKVFTISSRLFFYPYQKQYRIIVSDIDGTVTRSDVLGHLMPLVGHDWAHDGIAQLFTNLVKRGYILIYLSARNIGQASRTKNYLASISQGESRMPEGPVLTSTEGLFHSLNREIIQKNPQVFKIKLLRGIYKVFAEGNGNPFYAGFGNKETDAITYSTISIETKRIFTINDKSEIKVLQNGSTVNFTNLNQTINDTFPEFDPHVIPQDTEEEIRTRNRTNVKKVVHQSLYDPLFQK